MPRGARLDAPGSLHHVIIRGIEKQPIVNDDSDRKNFVTRLSEKVMDTGTTIYAWALLNNHAHLFIRSSNLGLPDFMRRFLTGYAISFNRRHNRRGHLFQNRYKSIICEEDRYFKELIRYIHLNPLRAGIVKTIAALDHHMWCGHSCLMDNHQNSWQDRQYVLSWFGKNEVEAKNQYREFVKSGMSQGRRPELTGGGIVRSSGGWSAVKASREKGQKEKGDERILGSGEFVSGILNRSEKKIKHQIAKGNLQEHIDDEISSRCAKENITVSILCSRSRRKPLPKIRKDLAKKLVYEYGVSLAETARQLGVSTSGISQMLKRD